MATKYLPEIIYAVALTSLSTHMLWQRTEAADARAHLTARLTLLENTAARLRAGAPVPASDFERIAKLARAPGADRGAARGTEAQGAIGWREVMLGRAGGAAQEHYEARDWAELKREAESAA